MITLRQKLYESLLDDEEDLIEDDTALIKNILNSNEFLDIYFGNRLNSKSSRLERAQKLSNGVTGNDIYIVKENELIFNGNFAEIGDIEKLKPIKEFLPNIDTLSTKNTFEIYANEISDKTLCKNIKAGKLVCKSLEELKNLNIEIDLYINGNGIPSYMRNYALVLSNQIRIGGPKKPISIKNVNVNMLRSDMDNIILIESPYFNDLSGLKSNADRLKIFRSTMFTDKDYINAFNSILDTTYTSVTGDGIERRGNIKTVIATLNNTKKYSPKEKLFKTKPGAKLSDVIDVKNMKKLKSIIFFDAYYTDTPKMIGFFKEENDAKMYVSSHLYRSYCNYIVDQLSDGWWVCIAGNKK